MNTQLLAGVSPEDKARVTEVLRRLLADPAMDQVRHAIKSKEKSLGPVDYDQPSWAYKQAHHNGYNQAVEDVLKLITTKE